MSVDMATAITATTPIVTTARHKTTQYTWAKFGFKFGDELTLPSHSPFLLSLPLALDVGPLPSSPFFPSLDLPSRLSSSPFP